ncbi:Arylsulfatase [Calycomorphotria hydatis]|uniref:Arylsulfatase n=2 Tax=Calycomorphotria hydatis TaxID=2528027 RepID=A0A517T4N9_9PLAN|nr:Arylsulfatase [Calycomorphotria hydatis]
MRFCLTMFLLLAVIPLAAAQETEEPATVTEVTPRSKERTEQRNIVFILCDDHRADALGFLGHPFLETPALDRMAASGAYFPNAYVTTSLCSPSRASILTGLYTHNHRVTDNYHPVSESLTFFPQLLQEAGYETAFFGKWHMGDDDTPQRGFDYWAAFRGQGTYWPDGHGTTRVVPQADYSGFNVNGRRREQRDYITDELTEMSLGWLKRRKSDKPYFLYISHKGVHSDFVPHDRHRGRYAERNWEPPVTLLDTEANRAGKPMWAINQRNSRHGADFGYNLPNFDVGAYYKRYCEALLAIDDHVGDVFRYLQETGELDNTLVVYMGDNGFSFGEHGLIDKRTAYDTSVRVPLLMHCPDLIAPKTRRTEVVANIDIAPTLLEVAGIKATHEMDGDSFYPFLTGKNKKWRDALLYEYFWEWNYPHTPTIHAVIGERYKYVRPFGLWDTEELYDMQADPHEQYNLIRDPEHQELAAKMKQQLFDLLASSHGDNIPLLPDRGRQFYHRNPKKAEQGEFDRHYFLPMAPVTR